MDGGGGGDDDERGVRDTSNDNEAVTGIVMSDDKSSSPSIKGPNDDDDNQKNRDGDDGGIGIGAGGGVAEPETEKEADDDGSVASYSSINSIVSSSSVSSSSSSSSSSILLDDDGGGEGGDDDDDDDEDEQQQQPRQMSLSERQAKNLERNRRFLADLHDKYKDKIGGPSGGTSNTADDDDHDDADGKYPEDEDEREDEAEAGPKADQPPPPLSYGMEMKSSYRLFNSFCSDPETTISTTTTDNNVNDTGRSNSNNTDAGFHHQTSMRKSLIDQLHKRYPHRQVEIRQLLAVLQSSISISSTLTSSTSHVQQEVQQQVVHVPAPIFCSGPKGCGKTSIVCDVVEVVQKTSTTTTSTFAASGNVNVDTANLKRNNNNNNNNNSTVKPAYIDCSIVEPSTIERLVYDTYRQLRPRLWKKCNNITRTKGKKRKNGNVRTNNHFLQTYNNKVGRQKQTKKPKMLGETSTMTNCEKKKNETTDNAVSTTGRRSSSRRRVSSSSLSLSGTSTTTRRRRANHTAQPSLSSPSVVAAVAATDAAGPRAGATVTSNHFKKKKNTSVSNVASTDDKDDKVETSHSAVMSLGRSLQQYYGLQRSKNGNGDGDDDNFNIIVRQRLRRPLRRRRPSRPTSAILILDNAEELLSLGSSPSSSSSSLKGKKRGAGGTSTAASASNKTTNYLAELLLLPKIMKLDLTIIVITKFSTLEKTRLNNLVSPSRSLGTIKNAIHPIVIKFPGYQPTTAVFRDILTTELNSRFVIGNSLRMIGEKYPTLKSKLVHSFWNTVIQFVSDTTRDVTDFIRIGRALWPTYVSLLHPHKIQSTMQKVAYRLNVSPVTEVVHHPRIEEELISYLSAQFYPKITSLASRTDNGLVLMALNEDGCSLDDGIVHNHSSTTIASSILNRSSDNNVSPSPHSFLRQCLILAAFICQSNRADQDKKMFSVQAGGKRRKRKSNEDLYGGNDEDIAFGDGGGGGSGGGTVGRAEQLKSLRLKSFPLERVLSIFVSLVQFNPMDAATSNFLVGSRATTHDGGDHLMLSKTVRMGSQRLQNDLSYFIDSGKLHPHYPASSSSTTANFNNNNKGEQINLSAPRFWCSLTKDEALAIADSINIQLERYLV